jgi:hypothetical protein
MDLSIGTDESVCNFIEKAVGDGFQKIAKKVLIFADCLVSWCFPKQHSFLF